MDDRRGVRSAEGPVGAGVQRGEIRSEACGVAVGVGVTTDAEVAAGAEETTGAGEGGSWDGGALLKGVAASSGMVAGAGRGGGGAGVPREGEGGGEERSILGDPPSWEGFIYIISSSGLINSELASNLEPPYPQQRSCVVSFNLTKCVI